MKETVIGVKWPFDKVPNHKWRAGMPWCWKFSWLFQWHQFSIQEFGGSRVNRTFTLALFCRCILTLHRDEYHNRSDRERADEYLEKWSQCDKELRAMRLAMLGDSTAAEVKKVIRESLGIDLDEGRIL